MQSYFLWYQTFSFLLLFIAPRNLFNRLIFKVFWLFKLEKMDPRAFQVEKHGYTWIRAYLRSKTMDPRVFPVEKHASARFSGSMWGRSGIVPG